MSTPRVVAVVGASGFIGAAVSQLLRATGHEVVELIAPRLRNPAVSAPNILNEAERLDLRSLTEAIAGCDAVVNAAGLSASTSGDVQTLIGANALLPAALERATRSAGVRRFLHVSSASVQGRQQRLDESATNRPDSPYTRSKSLAEQALALSGWTGTIILRPTSVHGPGRKVTRAILRVARSRYACVARPGSQPTPQVHVQQVARAVEILTDPSVQPPRIVLQPSEGFTTSSFLTMLACGRSPATLPALPAQVVLAAAFAVSKVGPASLWAQARRAEMLLFGQGQVPGWLAEVGPTLTQRHPAWLELIRAEPDTTELAGRS
jgi:Nucleoside-diphosphate-sugar epimerases